MEKNKIIVDTSINDQTYAFLNGLNQAFCSLLNHPFYSEEHPFNELLLILTRWGHQSYLDRKAGRPDKNLRDCSELWQWMEFYFDKEKFNNMFNNEQYIREKSTSEPSFGAN